MLPLRSVGRSNFVMVCVNKNFTTLIQKRHIMRTAVLYIYKYIYIYILFLIELEFKNTYIYIYIIYIYICIFEF